MINSGDAVVSSAWQSPSNIAIVKYWGKYENQIPANASVSFTLDNCHTKTEVKLLEKKDDQSFSFNILLDGKEEAGFRQKISSFFNKIVSDLPWLSQYHLHIESSNSFPHSSGIASSASGMSALALCLCSIQEELSGKKYENFLQTASTYSRLGSGSASRSVYGGLVVWGKHPQIPGSSELFAVPYPHPVHAVFENMQDSIMLVHKGSKKVSSTEGHDLMHKHPFAAKRFETANQNLGKLIPILSSGDLDAFIALAESEALMLHAMMMSSNPYFILMKPATLQIIEHIWDYRRETGIPVFFTLDAGANVHVLYLQNVKEQVQKFIAESLSPFCENGQYIHDEVGGGSKPLGRNDE